MKLTETIELKSGDFSIVKCPICGEETLDNYFICQNCGWEYDDDAKDDKSYSHCNHSTVKDYREKFFLEREKNS